ncbi:hypothetical protein EO98_11735 [Methanosarcina sp. 2.H.T.1A.6]|uniref:DUF58 domain-containing protein n=1 Tax=unclassified Methanosarcina TaxID=2644672 RepID=UPI000621EE5B|nr:MULTISPECIES: DUF58 domain-containing protein [unclassified Methanosarcina]KKG17571.1 hypothetical protein EO94_11890 [Methanosarcina sp. 2.H.T.1A.3]KKG20455.1 hypothetical protein EO98_11735 [Methanosarcina sp. 2.H.T.1A.6]KKG27345.1 hypothetical protein EO96_14225 [Methanosarcina sp. 2.H.T.1A.8]KKG27551.1 hypothetical protein EO97_01110 [Methanosarcina sp. 2.H.T.1A.15]
MTRTKQKIETDFFRQLDSFTFSVRKRVSTVYAGNRPSTRSGHGIDTIGFREYDSSDALKDIDWKAYARTEKLYVRQFEEEKTLTTHILLDASKSMDYPEKGISKFEYSAMLAAGFAYMVTKYNDRFAISTFTDEIDINKPRRGKKNLMRTIDRLSELELSGGTSISEAVMKYSREIKSRSLVILISDFMQDPEAIETALYRLSDHDLIVIQVLDPTEKELPLQGNSKLVDLETGEEIRTYISEKFKERYTRKLDDHTARIKKTCMKVGAEFHTYTTDTPIFDAFYHTIRRRRR